MKTSGFDMRPTIEWYLSHVQELIARLPRPVQKTSILKDLNICIYREKGSSSPLTNQDIAALVLLFPESIRNRWNVTNITFKGPLWFHRDSSTNGPTPTRDSKEALSPTAIVPSFVGHHPCDKPPGYDSQIELYALDPAIVPKDVQRVIHSQALVHELSHSFVTTDLRSDCMCDLGHGSQVSLFEHMIDICDIIEDCGPISHYASAYLQPNEKVPTKPDLMIQSIDENTVEVITAILMGFAFQTDGNGLLPFDGSKRRLHDHVDAYLFAQLVS